MIFHHIFCALYTIYTNVLSLDIQKEETKVSSFENNTIFCTTSMHRIYESTFFPTVPEEIASYREYLLSFQQ